MFVCWNFCPYWALFLCYHIQIFITYQLCNTQKWNLSSITISYNLVQVCEKQHYQHSPWKRKHTKGHKYIREMFPFTKTKLSFQLCPCILRYIVNLYCRNEKDWPSSEQRYHPWCSVDLRLSDIWLTRTASITWSPVSQSSTRAPKSWAGSVCLDVVCITWSPVSRSSTRAPKSWAGSECSDVVCITWSPVSQSSTRAQKSWMGSVCLDVVCITWSPVSQSSTRAPKSWAGSECSDVVCIIWSPVSQSSTRVPKSWAGSECSDVVCITWSPVS